MDNIEIIDADYNNFPQYEPTCFLNPKNKGYQKIALVINKAKEFLKKWERL
jgi:hypothetical protein